MTLAPEDRPVGDYVPAWRRMRRRLVRVLICLVRSLVAALPRHWDRPLGRFVMRLVRAFAPGLQRRVTSHLALVYGSELSHDQRAALAERVWDCWARSLTEFMRLGQLTSRDLRQRLTARGQGNLWRALARGRGIVLVTAHYGNFEMMAATCAAYGVPLTVVARNHDDDPTAQLIVSTRVLHGVKVISRNDLLQAIRVIRGGECLGILSDQVVLLGGVMADFLGHPAATSVAPVLLAKRTGAALLPCFVTRDANDRLTVEIHRAVELPESGDDEADLVAGVQRVNDLISAQIRLRPEEWNWFHRRWKKPLSVRRARRRSDGEAALLADDEAAAGA